MRLHQETRVERVLAVLEHVPPREREEALASLQTLNSCVRRGPRRRRRSRGTRPPFLDIQGVAMRTALVILVVLGLAAGGAAYYSTH